MIRAILAIVSWLDKRFPPKVTITKEAFRDLELRLSELQTSRLITTERLDVHAEVLGNHAKALGALKDALSKSGISQTTPTDNRRSEYIASGRMPT